MGGKEYSHRSSRYVVTTYHRRVKGMVRGGNVGDILNFSPSFCTDTGCEGECMNPTNDARCRGAGFFLWDWCISRTVPAPLHGRKDGYHNNIYPDDALAFDLEEREPRLGIHGVGVVILCR
jgi:hypothetical protein